MIKSAAFVCKHCGWNLNENKAHDHPRTQAKWNRVKAAKEEQEQTEFRKQAELATRIRKTELELQDFKLILETTYLPAVERMLTELRATEKALQLKLLKEPLDEPEREVTEFRLKVVREQIEKQMAEMGEAK